MSASPSHLRLPTSPIAPAGSVVRGKQFRITVLTQRLIRLEWSGSGVFEDRPTQIALHRDLPTPDFTLRQTGGRIEIDTPFVRLRYDRGPFHPAGLSARVVGVRDHHAVWRYGEVLPVGNGYGCNLGGTARTLDEVDGAADLEPGLLSTAGWAVVDDSRSLALDGDGWPTPRVGDPGDIDLYLFAHGADASACLAEFYRLTGSQPLLPRFAFGNWWSRYHRYSDAEYRDLFERFDAERIPFSVAVIDMDWHVTDVPDGDGWTGYTWNRELFPDPPALLRWLHDRDLRVTLNVHPADGVRSHEERYGEMCAATGVPADGRPVDFDIGSPRFAAAYLSVLHHPLEAEGVDFWWLDWQQGTWSSVPGLDPLWMLNHLHFLDRGRDGTRPLTFSRYAGVGSHRYPVGFSGDSIVSWASLDFQPYFTATAANVGYGWWSHDIGGHMFGTKDDELATRWVELGVVSPLLRLHSTNDPFNSKEPWRFGAEAERIMGEWLRFRHRLVPYLYTMNERAHAGRPLVRPLHHTDRRPETLATHGAFWFGDLLAAPITRPRDQSTLLGGSVTWLPAGTWIDLFTGVRYDGDRTVTLHRPIDGIPLLGAAGTIVPLTGGDDLSVANPAAIELLICAGGDGTFTLYEDDDAAVPSAVRTEFSIDWDTGRIVIGAATGDAAVVPAVRDYTITLVGVAEREVEGFATRYDERRARLTIEVGPVPTPTGATIETGPMHLADNRSAERVRELVDRAQIPFATKRSIDAATRSGPPARQLAALVELGLDATLLGAVTELIGASSP